MRKALLILLIFFGLTSCEEQGKSIEDFQLENDLCRFNEGVLIEISTNGSSKYMACLIDGKAEKIQVTKTLYKYVYEIYSPGDTVRCSTVRRPKTNPERINKVPLLE